MGNRKREVRNEKREIRNWEVGIGKVLNWTPRSGKWDSNVNSHFQNILLQDILQEACELRSFLALVGSRRVDGKTRRIQRQVNGKTGQVMVCRALTQNCRAASPSIYPILWPHLVALFRARFTNAFAIRYGQQWQKCPRAMWPVPHNRAS